MQSQYSQRARYRPSGGVDWKRFIPLALLIALLAVLIGAGFNWLYSIGWYIFPIPILTGFFAAVLVLLAISRGKCRSPAVGTLFGFLVGVLLYGGYFYFGMLTMLGPQAATRLDLLPKYVALRVRTDTTHDLNDSSHTFVRPDPVMNGFRFCFEAIWILVFTTAAGYRRSKRSFCEQCGKWKHQDLVFLPPGNGKTVASWLSEGTLDYLADVPPYSPRGRNRQSTLVALERCQPARPGCAYYLAVKDATTASGLGRFDGAFGRIRVPRVEITPDEVAALTPIFPAAEPPVAAVPNAPSPAARKSIGQCSDLIEVVPIPPDQAHQVLTPLHITISNLLGLWILPCFYGGIISCFVGFHYVTQQLDPRLAGPAHLQWWLIFTAGCVVLATLSGFVGLRNPSFAGNLYLRLISLRSIARRPQKWVDPANSRELPTHFVQVVPRQNWGTMKWETATDTGFLQIDPARNELRFEGDVHRYRIPTAAITDFSIASYGMSQRIKYSMVVLQGLTASGPWEAPISLRPTKIFAAKDHRQQSAQMLHDQIDAVLPTAQAAPSPQVEGLYAVIGAPGGATQTFAPQIPKAMPPLQPPTVPEYAHLRPSDLKPRTMWGSRYLWRLAIFLIVVGIGIGRGAYLAHQRIQQRTQLARMMAPQKVEPGPAAPRLPLTITNLHFNQQLTSTAPYYQPGGDWTVLECQTPDNAAGFTIAIEAARPVSPSAFQSKFAYVALLPADRNLGANLVAKLATALNQPLPPAESPQPLTATKLTAEVLGDNLGDPRLGLQAGKGSWTALQWVMDQNGPFAQIFFNYNVFTRSAEFVGGDADAIEGIASAIRDGPRPPRSEQNDPTFTSKAPTITDLTPIPGTKDAAGEFSRTGNLLIYYGFTAPVTIRALDLSDHRRPITIAQLDGRVRFISSPDHDDNHFLIVETANPAAPASPRAEHRIWWIDRSNGNRTEIKGPWGTSGNVFGQQPLSPDEKYCVISGLSGTVLDADRTLSVYFVNLRTSDVVKADNDHVTPGQWQGTGQNLQYITSTLDEGSRNILAIDPITGHCSPIQNPGPLYQTLSPDGQRIFRLDAKKSLTVTPANGGPSHILHFAPQDRRFAVDGNFQWLSPRYLAFTTTRQSFIDADQMKVGYVPTPTNAIDEDGGYQFDRNFNWALAYTPDGLMLGRVVLPPATR